jgi:hypothetical protein
MHITLLSYKPGKKSQIKGKDLHECGRREQNRFLRGVEYMRKMVFKCLGCIVKEKNNNNVSA